MSGHDALEQVIKIAWRTHELLSPAQHAGDVYDGRELPAEIVTMTSNYFQCPEHGQDVPPTRQRPRVSRPLALVGCSVEPRSLHVGWQLRIDWRPMADDRVPRTVHELRSACVGWPQSVVRRAVATVVPEPDAALVGAWLVDPEPSSDAPPVSREMLAEIWDHLKRERQ
jgi:hypothetical protein